MKQRHHPAFRAFIAWMRRYWGLIFFLLLVTVPLIIFMILGVSFGEAIRSVAMLTGPLDGRRLFHTYVYKPEHDIILTVIILAILAFITFSVIRYTYKSKK